MSIKKYRPYLNLNELKVILAALKRDNGAIGLIKYLEKYISDIEAGFRAANHTLAPSLEEKLGFSEPSSNPKEDLNSQWLFDKWTIPANRATMSLREILAARKYGYENDLMNNEEEQEYERDNGLNF